MSNDSTRQVAWNPWLGVIFLLIIFYAAQIAAALLISIYPAAQHWSHARSVSWLDNSISAQFVFILLAEGLSLSAVAWFLKRYKQTFADIGLKRPRWVDPLYGLAAVPVYFILYLLTVGVATQLVPHLNVNQTQELGFNHVSGAAAYIMAFISLVVLPPITEEIMVRGFLYSSLKKVMPTVSAVILTSAIFAAAHLPEGGAAGPLYIAALDTFVLSLVLIWLREKTGSLWASITLHALKNGIAFIALFVLHAR